MFECDDGFDSRLDFGHARLFQGCAGRSFEFVVFVSLSFSR